MQRVISCLPTKAYSWAGSPAPIFAWEKFMSLSDIKIGIANRGIIHHKAEKPVTLEAWFQAVSATGAFDYIDKTPPLDELEEYLSLCEKYDLPLLCGGWFYTLGTDEHLMFEHLDTAAQSGTKLHNVQIKYNHAEGRPVSNDEIAELYLRAAEHGDKVGCIPCFEIHIDMWSEELNRIEEVAALVEAQGVPFRMTLDHSHIIFKMDNAYEYDLFGLREHIEAGRLILDPFQPGNLAQKLIDGNHIYLMHARSVIPDNPKNITAHHPNGSVGRGVQYPFIAPEAGEYHSLWDGTKLAPWKKTVTDMLDHAADNANAPLQCISTEFIPWTDYSEGNTYSLLNNSVACAQWIRSEINDRLTKDSV